MTKRPLRCSTMMALSRISSLQTCDRCRTRGICSGCRLLRLSNSPWMACSGIASRLKSFAAPAALSATSNTCAYDCCSTCVVFIYVIWSLLLLLYEPVDREEWHVFGLCIATSMLDCASCINISCLHAERQTTGTFQLAHHSFPAQEVLL